MRRRVKGQFYYKEVRDDSQIQEHFRSRME